MPKIEEHSKNIPEAEERRRTFMLDITCTKSWKYFVSQVMLICSVVHVQLVFIYYFKYTSFLSASAERLINTCLFSLEQALKKKHSG